MSNEIKSSPFLPDNVAQQFIDIIRSSAFDLANEKGVGEQLKGLIEQLFLVVPKDTFCWKTDRVAEFLYGELAETKSIVKRIRLKEINSDTALSQFGMGRSLRFTDDDDNSHQYLLFYNSQDSNKGLCLQDVQSSEVFQLQDENTGKSSNESFISANGVVYDAFTKVLTFPKNVRFTSWGSSDEVALGPTEDGPFHRFEVVIETINNKYSLKDVCKLIQAIYYDKFVIDGILKSVEDISGKLKDVRIDDEGVFYKGRKLVFQDEL